MDELLARVVDNLSGRIGGPLTLRFIMQPLMACLFATRDGRRDAREGRPAYFWGLFTEPARRAEMLRDGWSSIAKVFLIALALDVGYQIFVFHWAYPGEAVFIAFLLAIVPYVLVRGLANRLSRLARPRERKTI